MSRLTQAEDWLARVAGHPVELRDEMDPPDAWQASWDQDGEVDKLVYHGHGNYSPVQRLERVNEIANGTRLQPLIRTMQSLAEENVHGTITVITTPRLARVIADWADHGKD